MFKNYNRTASRTVNFEYEDLDKVFYKVEAKVTINMGFQIESVGLLSIEASNLIGESIEPNLGESMISQLESVAAMKALEKFELSDFEKECEME